VVPRNEENAFPFEIEKESAVETVWVRGSIAAVVLSIVVIGCEQTNDQHQPGAMPSAAKTPPAREVTISASLASTGEQVYSKNCSACHGSDGRGRVGMAPSLVSKTFLSAATDSMLITTIKKGRSGTAMIPWEGKLKYYDIAAVVSFLRTKTPTEPARLNEEPLKGDADKGKKTFRAICSTCHGRTGAGYQESGSGTGIGRTAFLSTVSNGYLRYIIRNGKSGTPMRAFSEESRVAVANLKDQEIEDVIAYLRKTSW
jgi:mono/diheme cytochrome c family protein